MKVERQKADLIKSNSEYYDNVIRNNDGNEEIIKDIHGILYEKFVNSLSAEDRYNYATAIFNADVVPTPRQKFPASSVNSTSK